VSAVSLKQAFFFANNDIWVSEGSEGSEGSDGILWKYQRGREQGDHLLPSGSWEFATLAPRHGEGVKAIRQFLSGLQREIS